MPSVFMDSIAARHSMFPGSAIGPAPDMNLAGIPGLSGPEGAVAAMFLEPVLKQALGPGFLPGQFRPTHNLYDHYRRKAQFQAMQASVAAAAQTDQGQYVALLRGVAASAGVQWNAERERAAQMMAADMGRVSPMLAQLMPDAFDQMHGSRGSAAVMAQSLFSGGRYRLDPVTGMLGMSAGSVDQMNRELYARLYGPGADLAEMKGLGAGRAGMMFDELGRRGLLPRALARDEQLRGIARQDLAARGLSGRDAEAELGATMDGLRNLSSPLLEARVRQFEAARVGDRIKNMAGAVAAMRDVFGEMGRPDAPMTELIEGLQVLTQGGLATMDPGRVEGLVRDASNLARRSGMGMDNLAVVLATAAQRADAMGLDRTFGVTAGLGAAAFGSAYANTVGGSPAWGRGDRERAMAIDAQLRLNAADSPVANQLAATVRLGRDVGFKAGSEAAALLAAAQAGEETYEFGGRRLSVHAQTGRWREIMAAGGVDAGLASAYRNQKAYNQRFIDEADLGPLARRLQAGVDVAPRLSQAFQRAGRAAGISDRGLLGRLGEAAAAGLLDEIAPEDLQNPERVAEFLAGRLGVDKNDTGRMAQLRRVATLGWGNVEQMVKTNPRLAGYRTADQFVTAHRRGTLREGDSQVEQARQESRLQSALSGLGSGGPLARLMDAVAGATPATPIRDVIAKTLGWVPEGEVGQRLQTTVRQMQDEIKQFRDSDPEKIRKEAQDITARRAARAGKLQELTDQVGDRLTLEQRIGDPNVPEAERARLLGLYGQIQTLRRADRDDDRRLGDMANQYTGGNRDALLNDRNLGRTIRENALRKLRGLSPELRRQAEQAGLELGATASHEDAGRAWQAVRDRRAAGVTESDALAERMLHDDRSMSALGPDGLDLVRRVQGRNRDLRELAAKHAGGDVGVLMASDEQRKQAREAYGQMTKATADVDRLQREIGEAEARGDTDGANRKRAELEQASNLASSARNRLEEAGRAAGTSGERLARAADPDRAVRGRVEGIRDAQQRDLLDIQRRLREARRHDLTPDQKKAIEAERTTRRRTDAQVMDDLFRTLGVNVSAEDKASIAGEVLKGDRGEAIRQALPALQRLREIKKDMSNEQFQDYLRKGLGNDASAEEKELYHKVAAGRAGGGIAGIGRDNSRREAITERLRDFAAWQRDTGRAQQDEARRGPGGGDGVTRIEGTLTIPGLGEGRIHARGGRR